MHPSDILHASPIPQFVIDSDHHVLYWNKALEKYSGIPAEVVIGTNQQWRAFYLNERPCMADLLVDQTLEKIPEWYKGKHHKSGLVDDAYEAIDFFPHMGEKGTWLHFTAALIRDETDKIIGAVETLEDITGRKCAEAVLLQNEERYRSLFEGAAEGILVTDLETHKIIHANPSICLMLGYSERELTAMEVNDIHPKEYQDQIKEKLITLTTGEKIRALNIPCLRKDGTILNADISSSTIIINKKVCNVGFFIDVTNRRVAEDLFLKNEEGYSALFYKNHSVSLLIDPNSAMIVDANSAACEYYGYSLEELTRKGIYDINHLPREKVIRDLIKARTEKEKHFFSTHYLAGDEKRYVEVYSGPITVQGKALFYSIIHDITDRRLAELALVESESRLQSIVQGSPIPKFVIDKNHRVIYWNKALEKYSSIPADEVIGTNQQWRAFYLNERPCMADLLVDRSIEIIPQWYEGKFSTSKLVDGAYEATDFFPRMGIEGKWLYFTAAPIYDSTGRIIGAVETLEDITERKLAEKALRESEALLNDIVRGSPIPQFVVDQNHHVIYWNEALEICSGVLADKVVGTNQQWRAFYLNERPCMADLLVDGSIEKIPQWYEGKYSTSKLVDGAYEATDFFPRMGIEGKWLYFTAAPIRDETGRIIGAVETLEDITEKKLAEKALRESEALLNDIVRGSPIPQFVVDQNHHVIYWNEALEICSGVLADKVVGTNQQWRAFYSNERPCMADLLVDGSIEKIPQWYEGKYSRSKFVEGAYEATDFFPRMGIEGKWLYFTAAPIRDEIGKIIGAVETLEDITPQKKATENLAKKVEELARSNTELEQFAFIASHDLQEPLRMVGSYLQLIERRYKGRLDSDADEFIAYAVDGAQRLKNMINGLLEFSRVQTRGVPFQPVSGEKILAGSLLNMKMSIDETDAVITHDPLPIVMGDPDQLIRVLQNLINNAIKFRGEKNPQIHISARQEGDFWIFSVKDNGIGFEEKYRDQLFILFRRLLGSAYPGTGIGLAVCKRIIERHDGKIWAESQPGAGSTFFFTIPVRGVTIV